MLFPPPPNTTYHPFSFGSNLKGSIHQRLLGLFLPEVHRCFWGWNQEKYFVKGQFLMFCELSLFLILWSMNHNHSLLCDSFIRFTIKGTINGVFFAILIPFLTCTCFEVYFSTACKFALLLKRLPFISQAFMQVCILIQGYICFLPFHFYLFA